MTFVPPAARLLLATLALLLAACGSKEGRIESGLRKGAEFVRLADWDKANVEIRNVLQIDPKNAQAYYTAGQVSEAQREPQRAYGQYLKAVELKPDLLDAKVGLARLYLFTGDTARAETTVAEILAADATQVGARTLRAALLAHAGKAAEAITLAQSILAGQDRAPVDTSMLLAGLYANQNQRARALEVIERALQAEPEHLGLLQVAAQIVGSGPRGDALAEKAPAYYQRAIAAAPKNTELWLVWAAHHLRRDEVAQAEAVLRQAVRAEPADSRRRLALLDFVSSHHGLQAAENEYTAAIAGKPRDMALRFGLARLYGAANRPADAQRVLREIVDASDGAPSALLAKTQLAAQALGSGQFAPARRLIGEVLKANPRDHAALVLRSRLSLMDGRARDAVIDLRAAVRDQPGAVEIVQLLAQAHRQAGEPQLAREVLAEAVKSSPADPDLRAMLAADMADAKDYKAALSELEAGIKAAPQASRPYELKAQIALALGDSAGAVKALEQLKARRPQDALAYVRLGQLHASQRRFDAALNEYDAGAAAARGDLTPYIAAVGLLTGLQRFDAANSRIEAHLKAQPGNILHYQLKGDVAMARRDFIAAERAYRGVVAAFPGLAVGYIGVAKAAGARADIAAVLAVLAEGERAVPGELAIPIARAEWLAQAQRYDEAIAAYEGLHQQHPEDDAIANNLAYLLAETRGDRPSAERALALAARFADSPNPGFLDSLGWVHYQLGEYDKALALLERAVSLAPPSPLLQLHLGKALVKSGQGARGKEFLRKAVDSKARLPRLDEARAMLAQG